MPAPIPYYQVDFAGTLWQEDLICRGLAAQDQPANNDLTAYVNETSISTGRQGALQPFGGGRMSLLMDNSDYRFMPDLSTSPYSPLWDTGLPIRLLTRNVALDSLVSWWDFRNLLVDSYGDNDLANNNGVTNASPNQGSGIAATFVSASTQFLSVADNATLDMGAGVRATFGLWVNLTTKPASVFGIFSKWVTTGNQRSYILEWLNTTDRFRFGVSNNGTTITRVSADTFGAPAVGGWNFVTFGYDGTNIWISVNGGARDTTAFSSDIFESTAPLLIGAQGTVASSAFHFNGSLSGVFIFKRSLSEAEVISLYNSSTGLSFPDLTKTQWFGFVDSIIPQADDAQQSVTVECVDLTDKFSRALVTSGLHQQLYTGQLIARLISDGFDWRLDWTDLDDGVDLVPYAWWTNVNLLEAIQGVERSEGGFFFINKQGYPTFQNKYARQFLSTSGDTLGDSQVIASRLRRNLSDVANDIRVQAHPRYVYLTGVRIWQLDSAQLLAPNETRNFQAEYSDPSTLDKVPALNIIPPVATTDYGANDQANGGQVTSITVGTAGTGYSLTNPPLVTITGGGGDGARASAVVATGGVSRIVITEGGTNYEFNESIVVTISGGGGSGATASAVQSGGVIVAINITNPGIGYTSNPTVSITASTFGVDATANAFANIAGSIAAINVTNGGGGYTSNPTVTIEASPSGGTQATATATATVGTDRTTDLLVSANFQNFGQVANIAVTNIGTTPLYLTYLRLRGDPLVSPDTSPQIATDGTSISKYQRRILEIDQPQQQDIENAQDYGYLLIQQYANPFSLFDAEAVNKDTTDLALQQDYDLNDYFTTTLARYGLSSVIGFIGGYDRTISDYALTWRTMWHLEQSVLFSPSFVQGLILDYRPDEGVTTDTSQFSGTGTISQTDNAVTGTGTAFLSEVVVGDVLGGAGDGTVTVITDDTHLTTNAVSFAGSGSFLILPQDNASARVTSQSDQSGNNFNATQSGTKRPALKPGIQNGRDMLLYDGENDLLRFDAFAPSISGLNVPFTIFMVIKIATRTLLDYFFTLGSTSSASPYWRVGQTAGNAYGVTRSDNVPTTKSASGGTTDTSNTHIIAVTFDGTYVSYYLDDDSPLVSLSDFELTTATLNAAALGAFISTTESGFSNVYIGDVLAYNRALSTNQLNVLFAYLNNRWAVY